MFRALLLVVIATCFLTVFSTPLPQPDNLDFEIFNITDLDPFGLLNLTLQYFSVNIRDPVVGAVSGVSYWVNSVGQAVHYGDMVWGPEELLLSMKTTEEP